MYTTIADLIYPSFPSAHIFSAKRCGLVYCYLVFMLSRVIKKVVNGLKHDKDLLGIGDTEDKKRGTFVPV